MGSVKLRARRLWLWFALLLTTAGVVVGFTPVVAGGASASTAPVMYGVPYGHIGSNFVHGKVRPSGDLWWTGDGSAWFVFHRWSSWGQSNAWDSATLHYRSCWGSCMRYNTVHATLHLYRVRTHNGHPYFTRLSFTLAHNVPGLVSHRLVFCSRGSPAWYAFC